MSNIRSFSDLRKKEEAEESRQQRSGGSGGFPGGGGGGFPGGGGGGFPGFPDMFGQQGNKSEEKGKIKFLRRDGELRKELSSAGDKLVVVDFTASW